ncbi:glycosyltransferase family 2 protein [uncultured Methanobrevibacter sp.]|uniref:glycosyltransferase family 2 protein n=1 Tax=uncultured Methanobrevibacter sp. TaxID=253161 RepID=UPI0025E7BDB0|nr:glycosyltransferase family 2 protein [uncultured Methanobrevibacter sp.]
MISIIIPVYNSEKYIKRAFDSLFTQSIGFNNLEVIFIDDASTDDSPQIIEDYSNKYDNVKSFFLNKNSGAAGKPRNVGLSHATKDYIMFLDSDDYLMDNACEILYNEIIKENIDVVSGCISFDGSNPFVDLWMCILTDPHDSTEIRKKTTEKILKNDFPLLIDSIDDYESIIGDFGFVTKIYRRSLLENNSINFPDGVIAEDSVFLLNVLLNAKGIKYVNEIVYCYTHERTSKANPSMSHVNSKDVLKGLVDSFYKMYLLAANNGKLRIFKQYLLPQKLEYFLISRLFKSDLSVCEMLELLIHATALFKSCGDVNSNVANVFKFISNRDYENVLKVILGDKIPNQHDIKVISNDDSFKSECDFVELQYDSWLNQFESEKPQLFIYKPDENLLIDDIISYCDKNNIKHVLLNEDDFNFNQILDDIKFRYVPYLKHIVLFYELNDLNQLTKITNHFHSINYPFKHLKLLTSKENLFLSDTLLKSDLEKMDFDDNYYYCFVDADLSSSFIEIDFEEATFDGYNYENTVLDNSEFKQVVNNILSISKPEISVIIPTYNVENYLHNCISSVLCQSYENFEIVCIDDCSTDSTVKIIKQFMESDGRIRLFQNKSNMSLEFCRNCF